MHDEIGEINRLKDQREKENNDQAQLCAYETTSICEGPLTSAGSAWRLHREHFQKWVASLYVSNDQ